MIPQALKDLFSSKKFWLVILGSAIVSGLSYAGVSHDIIAIVAGLFGVNVASQGFVDGKKAENK